VWDLLSVHQYGHDNIHGWSSGSDQVPQKHCLELILDSVVFQIFHICKQLKVLLVHGHHISANAPPQKKKSFVMEFCQNFVFPSTCFVLVRLNIVETINEKKLKFMPYINRYNSQIIDFCNSESVTRETKGLRD
jgi:hypothetical protein